MLGDEDEAIGHLEKALSLRPGYADLHRELADRYIAGERYNEAIDELEKAVEINANYVEARLTLGLTYRRVDRKDEADEQFRKVLELDPRNPIARAQLSDWTPSHRELRKLHA
jgi:tetratricopeptide (TPR) repeat protein